MLAKFRFLKFEATAKKTAKKILAVHFLPHPVHGMR